MSEAEAYRLVNEADVKMIANIRRTPLVLGGMFLELTRSLYSFEQNLPKGVRTWSSTNEEGHVWVDLSFDWDGEHGDEDGDKNVNRRPAVIVDIGDLRAVQSPLMGIGSVQNFDLHEGVDYREDKIGGTVVWAHLGRTKAEAVNYASATYDLVAGLSFAIKRDFCLEKFQVVGILKPRLRKDQPRDYVSEVQATYEFREPYALKREAPKLKQITFEAVADTVNQYFNLVK